MKTLVKNLARFDVPGRNHHSSLPCDLPNCPGQTLLSIRMLLVATMMMMMVKMLMMLMIRMMMTPQDADGWRGVQVYKQRCRCSQDTLMLDPPVLVIIISSVDEMDERG